MLFLYFISGIVILVSVSIIFYKISLKLYYLLAGCAGLFLAVIFLNNNYVNIVSVMIIAGALAGFTLKNDKKFQFYIILTSFIISFISVSDYYYLKYVKDYDILHDSRSVFVELVNESGVSDTEKAEVIQKIDSTIEILKYIFPFTYFLYSLFLTVFTIYFLRFIINRKISKNKNYIDGIENFKIKEYLIFLFIGAWLAVLLIDRKYTVIYTLGLNTALILSVTYFMQALGIVKFIFRKRSIPFFILPGLILFFMFLGIEFFLFAVIVLSGLGALDFWLDFRKLNLKINK